MARVRSVLVFLAVAVATLVAPAAAPAQAPRPGELIAPGVSAAGVDLSNTTVKIATDRLEELLTAKLNRDVIVHAPGRTLRLKAADAKLSFDAARTARRALYAGRKLQPGQPADGPLIPPQDRVDGR